MNYPIHILKDEILQKGLKYIVENNHSNDIPYHNLNHLLQVTKNCHTIIQQNGVYVSSEERLNILFTALFHDFNYNLNLKSDKLKIDESKRGIEYFINNYDKSNELNKDLIFNILDATEYPYVLKNSELSYPQQVIRDADLMQIFETNFFYQNIYGLSKEMNISVSECVVKTREFFLNTTYSTDFVKKMREIHEPYVLRELDVLEEIFK